MNEVVIKPSLREQFLQGWAQCRVIFFSAPCGFGKSTAATALLSNHKTCVFSAEDPEFLREPVPKNVDAIVIDSLPALKDPEDQQTLCAWIRENPELHFVILSRGVLPGWLMPFRFTGLLSSSRPEICCLTAIPCVFFWKRMAAHQRKQRSTSSSTILSATRWP